MKSIAIFGGTFNPPHIAHEEIIAYLNSLDTIGKILIVPTGEPVHKLGENTAKKHRKNMCEIVANKFSKAEVWDVELTRKTKSYTYYTLLDYYKIYKEKPYFVCGADMLVTLNTWYKHEEVIKLAKILAIFRKGESQKEFEKAVNQLIDLGADVTVIDVEPKNISSSEIRGNGNAKKYVSKEILAYIEKNELYKENRHEILEGFKAHIKERLTEYRYYHSLCVAEEAVRLADRYSGNKEKAYIAGLLHDVLKDTSSDEQLKLAKEFGIIFSDLELGAKKLYHSIIGSEYVRRVLNITDEEIISAIRYHTTAKADMTKLEKILYLADYTSRDRNYNGVEEMREAVEQSMEKGLQIALKFTIDDLKQKGVPVHPDTLSAYSFYVK